MSLNTGEIMFEKIRFPRGINFERLDQPTVKSSSKVLAGLWKDLILVCHQSTLLYAHIYLYVFKHSWLAYIKYFDSLKSLANGGMIKMHINEVLLTENLLL